MTIAASLALIALVLSVCLLIVLFRRGAPGSDRGLMLRLETLELGLERSERGLRDELSRGRQQSGTEASSLRETLTATLVQLGESVSHRQADLASLQQRQWDTFHRQLCDLTASNERKLEDLRQVVQSQLDGLQADTAKKLDEMRQTVNEKLQATLEERLGASFRQVSDRLEQVHRGLGEMHALASGVGDLKRVLANVRSRGAWGEVQLASLLEQVLSPDQYEANVATREGSSERVEFALRLPGSPGDDRDVVWLPIDAKFPLEDYYRLTEAADRGDAAAVEQAARELESRMRTCARDIRDRYVEPPRTTDFALLFLPTEGLYAEVLRRPGLVDFLQQDARVVVAGPTTLWAILSSLRMGFRTLAIQRRSSEVWALLAAVKSDFSRFGSALDAVQKKLNEASGKIDEAQRGTRRIERRLRDVQELPAAAAARPAQLPAPLFEFVPVDDDEEGES